jgi:hypothetical protein
MSLPGLKNSFTNADLNAMQVTAASGINNFSNGVGQVRMDIGQVFLESTPIIRPTDDTFPFQVTINEVEPGIFEYMVYTGTVNNVIPKISGKALNDATVAGLPEPTAAGDYVIAIKCYADAPPVRFPKTNTEMVIISSADALLDTDEYGFIGVATLVLTAPGPSRTRNLQQMVKSSLWAERHKYTQPGTAWYYFYRV